MPSAKNDFKKFGIYISGSITTLLECIVNLINPLGWRQLLNAISVSLSIAISIFIIYRLKCFTNNILITNNEERIKLLNIDKENDINLANSIDVEIKKLKDEIFKLKNEKSKIDFF